MLDSLETAVSVRGICQAQIFCGCGNILDMRTAVEVTIFGPGANRANRPIIFSKGFCGKHGGGEEARTRAESQLPRIARMLDVDPSSLTVEVHDGSTVDWAVMGPVTA